jgi:hypothetical protein
MGLALVHMGETVDRQGINISCLNRKLRRVARKGMVISWLERELRSV